MSAEWIAISNALADATEKAAAHAVAVHAEPRGSSSGIIWRPGLIVTAEHALRRDEEIQVTLPDGKVASAKLQGRDPSSDLALLKCEAATASPAAFAESARIKAGQLMLVVGRTRASGPVAALGCVSLVAVERRIWGALRLLLIFASMLACSEPPQAARLSMPAETSPELSRQNLRRPARWLFQ